MAPSKHLGCPLCTGRSSAQRPASLHLPHTRPCLLLSQSTGGGGTALASLLCAWIIYIFKKKLAIQVTSIDFSRTKSWAKSTVDIYGEKMGLGFCLLCLFDSTMRSYHIACVIHLTGCSLRLFPSSLLQEQAMEVLHGSSDPVLIPCAVSYSVAE